MDPLDTYLQAALEQAGMAPRDERGWAAFRLVYDAMTPMLDRLAATDLGAVAPEFDLDPSRGPTPL